MSFKISIFSNIDNLCVALISKLSEHGHRVTLYTEHTTDNRELQILNNVVLKKPFGKSSVDFEAMMKGHEVVINLLSSMKKLDKGTYQKLHVETSQHIIRNANKSGVTRLLYLSSYLAHPTIGQNEFLRTKGEAESVFHSRDLPITSFKPTMIIGKGDIFTKQIIDWLINFNGTIPMSTQTFRPMYVDTVVDIIINSIGNYNTFGKRIELVGKKSYTFLQLAQTIYDALQQNKKLMAKLANHPLTSQHYHQPNSSVIFNNYAVFKLLTLTPFVKYITPSIIDILKAQATDDLCEAKDETYSNNIPIETSILNELYQFSIKEQYNMSRKFAQRI